MFNRKEKKAAEEARKAQVQAQRKNACVARRRALRDQGVDGWPTDGCNIPDCGKPCR